MVVHKSQYLIGIIRIAKFGPNRARFFRAMLRVSVDRRAIIESKSTGKQEIHCHKSSPLTRSHNKPSNFCKYNDRNPQNMDVYRRQVLPQTWLPSTSASFVTNRHF